MTLESVHLPVVGELTRFELAVADGVFVLLCGFVVLGVAAGWGRSAVDSLRSETFVSFLVGVVGTPMMSVVLVTFAVISTLGPAILLFGLPVAYIMLRDRRGTFSRTYPRRAGLIFLGTVVAFGVGAPAVGVAAAFFGLFRTIGIVAVGAALFDRLGIESESLGLVVGAVVSGGLLYLSPLAYLGAMGVLVLFGTGAGLRALFGAISDSDGHASRVVPGA